MSFSKLSFAVVSILSILTGVGLAAGGIWYSSKLGEVTQLRQFELYQLDLTVRWPLITPYILAAAGLLAVLISSAGLCGMKSRGCLMLYTFCSVLVLLSVIGAGVISIVLAVGETQPFVTETLKSVFDETGLNADVTTGFHLVETEWICCGVHNVTSSYLKDRERRNAGIPDSCCDRLPCTTSYRNGCVPVLARYTEWAFYIGAAGCVVLAVLAIFSFVLAVILAKRRKEID